MWQVIKAVLRIPAVQQVLIIGGMLLLEYLQDKIDSRNDDEK